MQPHPMTSVMQLTITGCAVCVAAAALTFSAVTIRAERNAALVSIGVSVLRADPKAEVEALIARKWALDLIDANSGGVKFSPEARAELLQKRLTSANSYESGTTADYSGYTYCTGNCPLPRRPALQPHSN